TCAGPSAIYKVRTLNASGNFVAGLATSLSCHTQDVNAVATFSAGPAAAAPAKPSGNNAHSAAMLNRFIFCMSALPVFARTRLGARKHEVYPAGLEIDACDRDPDPVGEPVDLAAALAGNRVPCRIVMEVV